MKEKWSAITSGTGTTSLASPTSTTEQSGKKLLSIKTAHAHCLGSVAGLQEVQDLPMDQLRVLFGLITVNVLQLNIPET